MNDKLTTLNSGMIGNYSVVWCTHGPRGSSHVSVLSCKRLELDGYWCKDSFFNEFETRVLDSNMM